MSTKSSLLVAGAVLLAGVLMALSLRQGGPVAAQEPGGQAKVRPAGIPIVSGKLVSVKVFTYPLESKSNEASTCTEGRVDVYERFIVVSRPSGDRTLHLHGYYTDLRFKAE